MLLQDIDALLHNYAVNYSLPTDEPISLPGDRADMAKILAHLTLLLTGANACIPHIVNSVWGENNEAHFALGRPHGGLSLICQHLLALSKIAINTIYTWITDPELSILAPTSSFKQLPTTLQTLLLHSPNKITYTCELVPSGATLAKLLTDNLQQGTILFNNLTFKTKAIQWHPNLLLNKMMIWMI
jgi:hypothetical protein